MQSTAKKSAGSKVKTSGSKTSTENKSANGKKQGAVNLQIPTARDKAKNFDEARRNDANSNEL